MTRGHWTGNFRRSTRERRTSADGKKTFASLAERKRYDDLVVLERAGKIRDLKFQVAFPLVIVVPDGANRPVKTPTGKTSKYTADFVYLEKVEASRFVAGEIYVADEISGVHAWREVIEDVKGFMSEAAALRIAVFEAIYDKVVTIVKVK